MSTIYHQTVNCASLDDMQPSLRVLVVIVLITTLIGLCLSASSGTWCSSRDPETCNSEHHAVLSAPEEQVTPVNEQDEEVVLNFEATETQFFGRRSFTKAIRNLRERMNEYRRMIRRNKLCASNCRWIRVGDQACDQCTVCFIPDVMIIVTLNHTVSMGLLSSIRGLRW